MRADHLLNLLHLKNPIGAIPSQGVSLAKMVKNERLTSVKHDQDTRKLSLSFKSNHDYIPGDVLMIQPQNNE